MPRRRSLGLVIILAVAAASLCGRAAAVPAANVLVVPGRSVGAFALGMNKDAVFAAFGHPDTIEDVGKLPQYLRPVAVSMFAEQYRYTRYGIDLFVETFAASTVRAIGTWNPAVSTADGVRMGTRRAAVLHALGSPQHSEVRDREVRSGSQAKPLRVAAFLVDSWSSKGLATFYSCPQAVDCRQYIRAADLGQTLQPELTVSSIEVFQSF